MSARRIVRGWMPGRTSNSVLPLESSAVKTMPHPSETRIHRVSGTVVAPLRAGGIPGDPRPRAWPQGRGHGGPKPPAPPGRTCMASALRVLQVSADCCVCATFMRCAPATPPGGSWSPPRISRARGLGGTPRSLGSVASCRPLGTPCRTASGLRTQGRAAALHAALDSGHRTPIATACLISFPLTLTMLPGPPPRWVRPRAFPRGGGRHQGRMRVRWPGCSACWAPSCAASG